VSFSPYCILRAKVLGLLSFSEFESALNCAFVDTHIEFLLGIMLFFGLDFFGVF
jgi:hypothetical protein